MKIIILILVSFVSLLFGSEINQSSTATADSKSKACQKALLQAQKEALHQSGINIFTSFESKTTMTDNEVKKVIDNSLQSSYGTITTISKKEKVTFDNETGYITCEIDGIFEVDTSKLKSQMLAFSKQYDNQYKEETNREKALNKKALLMQKYINLKENTTQYHIYKYNGSYSCREEMTIKECKKQFDREIKSFFLNKISQEYNIDSSLVTLSNIEKSNTYKSKFNNSIILSYNGDVKGKALSVENPYFDEINSLNVFLGKKEIPKSIKANKIKKITNDYLLIGENYLSKNDKEQLIKNNTLVKLNATIHTTGAIGIYFVPVYWSFDSINTIYRKLIDKLLKQYRGDFLLNIRFEKQLRNFLVLQNSEYILVADVYKKGKN